MCSDSRSPTTLSKLNEEEIRDLLLIVLNSHFEGQATGEAFNGAGKTDILVRVDNRNVFIGECKVYDGPKVITDAMDQLRGYLVWRDAHAALIAVIRGRKDPREALRRTVKAIKEHSSFLRESTPLDESSGRFEWTFRHGDDAEAAVKATLIGIVVRKAEQQVEHSQE